MGLTQITTLAWIALAVLAAAPAPAAAATGACASEQLLAPAAAWAGAASASASAGEKFTYDFTQTRAAWGPVTVVTLYYKAASACLDGAALTFGPADGGAGGAPAAAAAPGGVERIQSTVKALGAPHVGVSRGLFIQARTLSLAPGDRITRVDLKASGKCIQWMRLVTAKGAAVAAGAAPPAARMQTLAAPAGAYLYTLNARTAIADNGPLEQIQPVWATCAGPAAAAEAGPSSAAPAPVLAPAPGPAGSPAPAFQLSSCRKTTPTACDVSGAASGKGMCAGQQWQADACRAAGLGNNLPQLACQGVQTPATYKLAVKANNGTTQPTPDCSNLACRLRARGCRADPSNSTFCWGTVVRADADAPLSALAAGYLGYPCLDKQTAEVTDAASGYSNFNVLRPGQEGVYAKGYWQVRARPGSLLKRQGPVAAKGVLEGFGRWRTAINKC